MQIRRHRVRHGGHERRYAALRHRYCHRRQSLFPANDRRAHLSAGRIETFRRVRDATGQPIADRRISIRRSEVRHRAIRCGSAATKHPRPPVDVTPTHRP